MRCRSRRSDVILSFAPRRARVAEPVDFTPLALTLQVATTGTAIAVVLGVAVALLLATRKFPGRDVLDVLLTAPMVLPPTVLGYYVLVALGRRSALGHA